MSLNWKKECSLLFGPVAGIVERPTDRNRRGRERDTAGYGGPVNMLVNLIANNAFLYLGVASGHLFVKIDFLYICYPSARLDCLHGPFEIRFSNTLTLIIVETAFMFQPFHRDVNFLLNSRISFVKCRAICTWFLAKKAKCSSFHVPWWNEERCCLSLLTRDVKN